MKIRMIIRNLYKAVCFMCISLIVINSCFCSVNASEKSDGQNMQLMLKAYKAKKYNKARKYAKKVKLKQESAVSNMTDEVKKAYLDKVNKYIEQKGVYSNDRELFSEYVWDYYLTDIDNDKTPELLILYGSCEADARYDVFTYKEGRIKKVGYIGGGHTVLCSYPNHNGILCLSGWGGYESISIIKIKDNKIKTVKYGSHACAKAVGGDDKYVTDSLKGLKSHVDYYDSGDAKVDLSVFD